MSIGNRNLIAALVLMSLAGWVGCNSYESLAFANYFDGYGQGDATNLYIYGVVPQVIDFIPYYSLYIYYAGGVQVSMGQELTADQTASPPIEVRLGGTGLFAYSSSIMYTLFLVDIDDQSPDDPTTFQYLQYLVCNVPGEDLVRGTDLSNGTVLASYEPTFTIRGDHRYVFVVHEQRGGIDIPEVDTGDNELSRVNFSIRRFARQNHLFQAVAANFYKNQPLPGNTGILLQLDSAL